MRRRGDNFVGLVLAILIFGLSVVQTPGRAEAQMRCVGASPHSAPCARVELPAAGLNQKQMDGMMACCRLMRGGSMFMRGCPILHAAAQSPAHGTAATLSALPASLPSGFSGHCCLVSIQVFPASASAPAIFRTHWFLTGNPALAPPATASLVLLPALSSSPVFSPLSPVSPPPALPHIHGLRAPPTA